MTREGGSGCSGHGENSPERRGGGARAPGLPWRPRTPDTGWESPPVAPPGLGGQWNEPGPDVWGSVTGGQRGREKTVLVRNWSDDDGLQMDYGEEQSQEDAK